MFTPVNCPCGDTHEVEETKLDTKYDLPDFIRQEVLNDTPTIVSRDGREYRFLRDDFMMDVRGRNCKDYLVFYTVYPVLKRRAETGWSIVRIRTLTTGHPNFCNPMPIPCPWQTEKAEKL